MLTFILTFTVIGAVSGAACGALAYEPARLSRRGLSHYDVVERRAQSLMWAGIAAMCSFSLAMLTCSVAVNGGVA